MSFSFTDVIQVYFIVAIVLIGGGAISLDSAELVQEIVTEEDGGLEVDEGVVGDGANESGDSGGSGGWLSNPFGPLSESTDSVFGGGLLAVGSIVTDMMRFLAWPVAVSYELALPYEIQLLAGVLVMSMVAGVLKTLRASA